MNEQKDLRYLIQQNQEDLLHLIQQNQEDQRHFNDQIQRQLQQMQAHFDHMHAVVYSRFQGREPDTEETSPYYYGCRRYLRAIVLSMAIVGLIFGCGWNLREILQDMLESPTVTKITYTLHDKLPLPPISIFQYHHSAMLHTEKLFKALENGSLTQAYLEGIIKGVGIEFLFEQNITVQPSEVTEAYKQAILQYGSLTAAGLAFQKEYGITCDELFTYCRASWSPPMNCCDIFEVLWGLRGPQYTLKRDTIYLDTFQDFWVKLLILPKIRALQEDEFVKEPGNFQSYWLSINNDVDQTGMDAHTFEIQLSERVFITLSQKRRSLRVSEHCVDLPPKLRYFRDYTITNCYFERCYIDRLPLCNISCEIPLLHLMNPENYSGPPCEFDAYNSMCRGVIQANILQCNANHGCRFPCNYTEVEHSVTKEFVPTGSTESFLFIKYGTSEIQTFEETARLTQWEYLSLISSILDLWLGITIYSLYRMLHRGLSKSISYFKPYDFGNNNSAAAYSFNVDQQQEMADVYNAERDRRIRSGTQL